MGEAEESEGPRIWTERLVLRQPGPEEAELVAAYYQRNRAHHGPWDPPRAPLFFGASHWEGQLERNARDYFAGRSLRLFLFEREPSESRVCGSLNLSGITRGPFQNALIGYSLDEACVGRGYMSEALGALVAFAFGELELHRLEANYVPTNTRSGAVLRRLGFQIQGYARDYLFIAGAWRDHVLTAITNPENAPPNARL